MMSGATAIWLQAGDYIELYAYTQAAAATPTGGTANFIIARINA